MPSGGFGSLTHGCCAPTSCSPLLISGHTVTFRYAYAHRSSNVYHGLANWFITSRFLCLDLPSWLLPLLVEYALPPSSTPIAYRNAVAIAQLFVFFNAIARSEAFPLLERLVHSFATATRQIVALLLVIAFTCWAFAVTDGIMFGVAYPETGALPSSSRLAYRMVSNFQILIAGADLEDDLLATNRIGFYLKYFACSAWTENAPNFRRLGIHCGRGCGCDAPPPPQCRDPRFFPPRASIASVQTFSCSSSCLKSSSLCLSVPSTTTRSRATR